MDKYIGQKLDGRYEILALVGEGGMSNVYRGYDLLEERTVALKILKEELRDNEELVRRFKNESRAISLLNQENIIKVFDVSVNEKLNYIVMEFIEGITLKEYIEQRGEPLTYKESVLFISQVLRALQHAHDKGIVHRDVKPQNIMLCEDGTVKMMDFGIARMARSEIHTDGEQAIGSVHYISPEQAQGADTDMRADIYSAGIMLYEMLSGRLPFESDSAVSIAIQQISDEAVPLCEQNPSVPEGLGTITMKAMAKDPKNRYQTALEMLRDIEEFKRNPSVKFEYDYLLDNEPARYIGKVANNTKNPSAKKPATKAGGGKGGKAGKKKKKKRGILVPIVGGLTAAIVLVCGLLCYNIFQNSNNPLFVDLDEIALPNFVGMQKDEALALLETKPYQNLRLMEIQEEYNENLAPGAIISQSPSSDGSMNVKENQRLYLTVNRSIEMVPVPDVAGMTRAEARNALIELGVRPYVVTQTNDAITAGRAFATDPPVGTLVENTTNTTVKVYISSNATNWFRQIPNLIDLESVVAAQNLLEQNNLNLSMVKTEYSDMPEGWVIGQYPEPGVTKSKGYGVTITVSMGPEPAPEPEIQYVSIGSYVGWDLGSAMGHAGASGITLVKTGDAYSDTVPAGNIISQDPGPGDYPHGSVFGVVVSLGPDPSVTEPPITSVPDPTPPEG